MKQYIHYQLVKLDFKEQNFRFCHISLVKLNKTLLQLISHTGKLGNKGKSTILMELEYNEENLKAAIQKAKDHMRSKKKEGFHFQEDIENKISNLDKNMNCCSQCGDFIEPELYLKINEWARNEGGWDSIETCAGYQKVLCIPCQIEGKIYKKRVKPSEKSKARSDAGDYKSKSTTKAG